MIDTNLNRGQFFVNVEVMGNDIIERYIDIDGKEKIRKIKYEPTLFMQTHEKTKYKDIYGNHCVPKKFSNMGEARKWMYQKKSEDDLVLGMDNFTLAYLSDAYPDTIKYDISKLRIAIFDIEVTTDGPFPDETEAEYPIDAISVYDTLDDVIYVYDLLEDKREGVPRVKPWTPQRSRLEEKVAKKVVYKTYTCSDQLLIEFVEYLRTYTPSLLVGWNSEKFDIPYIMNRLKKRFGLEYSKRLSPYNDVYERTSYDAFENKFTSYKPKGLPHMDYMDIYDAFRFKKQPSMKLDYIGIEETGRGKFDYGGPIHTLRRGNYLPTIKPEVHENDPLSSWLYIKYMINYFFDRKIFNTQFIKPLMSYLSNPDIEDDYEKIMKIFQYIETDNHEIVSVEHMEELKTLKDSIFQIYSDVSHRTYIDYSIFDVQLVKYIDESLSFLELVFDIAYYAKMPIDWVMSKIQIWDAIIFNSLKKDNIVVPMKEIPEHNERIVGAFVKDPIVGIHRRVMSFDFSSLYPFIMIQVNISPEKLVGSFEVHLLHDYINKKAPRPSDTYSCSPNGWMYSKDEMGVLPKEVYEVYKQRKQLRKEQLCAENNAQIVEIIFRETKNFKNVKHDLTKFDPSKPFTDDIKQIIGELSNNDMVKLEMLCQSVAKTKNTGQLNRKILINSAYGAMANKYFRYTDNRNASAVTMFGQLAIQWAERKINEYINKILGKTDLQPVFYIDTDSVYINVDGIVDKVGVDKFKDTNHIIDFLDKFAKEKMEPMLKEAFQELTEYMNNMGSYMNMDREVIAMADINSDGFGAFWTGKKRYALNVYDSEGTRFAEPKLKIMGIETQRSSTPKIVSKGLEESIRIMLQEGEVALQEYVEDYKNNFLMNYRELDYKELASVSSANNLNKYSDENLMPLSGCPGHVKGALAYNRLVHEKNLGIPIREGQKIMQLKLKEVNPYKSERIAWESGENIPYELTEVLDYVDYMSVLDEHFYKSLSRITDACNVSYEYASYEGAESFLDMFF